MLDLLNFVERQTAFIIRTTKSVKTYHDFLLSDTAMVLFNSTCMCLQTIGETIRQIDNRTRGQLFAHYEEIPWRQIIGMRNIISHEYLSVDPELVLRALCAKNCPRCFRPCTRSSSTLKKENTNKTYHKHS